MQSSSLREQHAFLLFESAASKFHADDGTDFKVELFLVVVLLLPTSVDSLGLDEGDVLGDSLGEIEGGSLGCALGSALVVG